MIGEDRNGEVKRSMKNHFPYSSYLAIPSALTHQAVKSLSLVKCGLTQWLTLTKRMSWKWQFVTSGLGLERSHSFHSIFLGSQLPYQETWVRLLNTDKQLGQKKASWERTKVPRHVREALSDSLVLVKSSQSTQHGTEISLAQIPDLQNQEQWKGCWLKLLHFMVLC